MVDKTIDYFGLNGIDIKPLEFSIEGWGSLFRVEKPKKIKKEKRIFQKKIRKRFYDKVCLRNVTGKKNHFFDNDRILTDKEWEHLTTWKNSKENFELKFKRGDQIKSRPNKWFYSYNRKAKNGEKWKFNLDYIRPIKIKSEDFFRKRKLVSSIRSRILRSLKKGKFSKKNSTESILNINFEGFLLHLESLFEPWMNWSNYGNVNKKCSLKTPKTQWDIDHIIPLSMAKTEEDILRLNVYTNLQPLCSSENRWVKRNKMIYNKGTSPLMDPLPIL